MATTELNVAHLFVRTLRKDLTDQLFVIVKQLGHRLHEQFFLLEAQQVAGGLIDPGNELLGVDHKEDVKEIMDNGVSLLLRFYHLQGGCFPVRYVDLDAKGVLGTAVFITLQDFPDGMDPDGLARFAQVSMLNGKERGPAI